MHVITPQNTAYAPIFIIIMKNELVRIRVIKIPVYRKPIAASTSRNGIGNPFIKERTWTEAEKRVRDKNLLKRLIAISNTSLCKSDKIEPKINFERGFEPERIDEFILVNDCLLAMVKWEHTDIADPVVYEELKTKYPEIVLKYFQSKIPKRRRVPRPPKGVSQISVRLSNVALQRNADTESPNIDHRPSRFLNRCFSDWQQHVKIHPRIERSPTDLLKALESTIRRDPTAAHFKYHDDPYLIPVSNIGKRSFALSQESGKKAAQWVKKQHPELFQHREADPVIASFLGENGINESTEVTEDLLLKTIDDRRVSDAVFVFNAMAEKNLSISSETKIRYFELICFYNGEDTIPDEHIEERWFQNSSKNTDHLKKAWKNDDVADKLFSTFEEKDARIYSAIIQGMVKYNEADKAWQLFEEARGKKMALPIEVYNKMISIVPQLQEMSELRMQTIDKLLKDIEQDKLIPNVQTLNEVLQNLHKMGANKFTRTLALKVLVEFRNHLNISPSLGTWYLMSLICSRERPPSRLSLYDIMNEIENQQFEIMDKRDVNFFVTAMDNCCTYLNDLELAHRVYNLLLFGNNSRMIGSSYKESIFYRYYFTLMIRNEPLEILMNEIYDQFVPNIYTPEPSVMEELLNIIEMNYAYGYVSKIWDDLVAFDHVKRDNIVTKLFNFMTNCPQEQFKEEYAKIAWQAWQKFTQTPFNRNYPTKTCLNGSLLGNLIVLLLNGNEYQKACEIFKRLRTDKDIMGLPNLKALNMFVDKSIDVKEPTQAINCIKYCHENGFDNVQDSVTKINEKMTLSQQYLDRIESILVS